MKRTLLSLMLLLGLVLSPTVAAAAQPDLDDQTFTSEVTGDDVELGTSGQISFIPENYNVNETRSFQEEYIWFTYNWSNFQLVFIAGPNETAEYHDITLGNMEAFYDSWVVIDEEITEDHSWFLGEATLDDLPLIVYYEFELDAFGEVDLVVMQFTDASYFVHDLEFAQTEVTIGGAPLLPETDTQALAQSIAGDDAGNTSERSGDTQDAGATEEADDEGETSRDRSSRTSRTNATDDADATAEVNDEGETSRDRSSRTSRTTGSDDADATAEVEDEGEASRDRSSRTSRTTDTEESEDEDASGTEETSRDRTSRTSRSSGSDDADVSDDSENDDRTNPLGDMTTGNVSGRETDAGSDDSTAVSGGDWGTMGLVSDTEWVSPAFGTVLTWDDATWEFPIDYDQAIVIDGDAGFESVTLQTVEDGVGYVFVTVEQNRGSTTPQSLIAWWTSPEYGEQFVNGISILDSASTANTASIIYETTNIDDDPLLVVLEATFLDDGTLIFSQISAAPTNTVYVFELYAIGVEVNGEPLDLTWTVEDIRQIIGS